MLCSLKIATKLLIISAKIISNKVFREAGAIFPMFSAKGAQPQLKFEKWAPSNKTLTDANAGRHAEEKFRSLALIRAKMQVALAKTFRNPLSTSFKDLNGLQSKTLKRAQWKAEKQFWMASIKEGRSPSKHSFLLDNLSRIWPRTWGQPAAFKQFFLWKLVTSSDIAFQSFKLAKIMLELARETRRRDALKEFHVFA